MWLSDRWQSFAVAACIFRLCSHFSTFCYQQRKFFSQKIILKNYFSFRYQKRKLSPLKRKQFFFVFFFLMKKEDKTISFDFEKGNNYFYFFMNFRRGSLLCTVLSVKIIFGLEIGHMTFLISKKVAEMDYSVKISKRRLHVFCYLFLLKIVFFYFWPRNWHFHDLELKLPLQMTLKMTLNHENNTINGFSHSKTHEKEVLHMLLALFVQKWYFHSLDPKIDLLTLNKCIGLW